MGQVIEIQGISYNESVGEYLSKGSDISSVVSNQNDLDYVPGSSASNEGMYQIFKRGDLYKF